VLADSSSGLDGTLATLNQALSDVKGFLHDNNSALIGSVNKLNDFTKLLSDQSEDIEQVLHVAPNAAANFYNIYNPAQGTLAALVSLPNFANPVQFICGGIFEAGASPDNFKRAEICRERMAPVLRRITMNYPPFLFHPINSITAYKGQIIYDTPQTEAKAATPFTQLIWQPAPGTTPPPAADLMSLFLPPTPGAPQAAAPTAGTPADAAPAPTGPLPGPAPVPAEVGSPAGNGPLPADQQAGSGG
jgi:phospholipid/cholesterol/gamma-HCH transport system substrate-binding protein